MANPAPEHFDGFSSAFVRFLKHLLRSLEPEPSDSARPLAFYRPVSRMKQVLGEIPLKYTNPLNLIDFL
ncbi:hypothetical protein [Pseudomonas sp. FG-3G]|nr:hypothetical protein [Pseudomonas sp. FG-3G]